MAVSHERCKLIKF